VALFQLAKGVSAPRISSIIPLNFNYHAIPGNIDSLSAFRYRVILLRRSVLIHRSQKHHPHLAADAQAG
jgi:hypothetical protein